VDGGISFCFPLDDFDLGGATMLVEAKDYVV